MRKTLSWAFWADSALAFFSAFLAILTLVWRDWLEVIFGFDPDRHSGSFEWGIVIICFLVAVLFSAHAGCEWRKARLAAA
jgi:hypothetical protein